MDDLIADGIGHSQISLGPEEDRLVCGLAAAGGASGKVDDFHMFRIRM